CIISRQRAAAKREPPGRLNRERLCGRLLFELASLVSSLYGRVRVESEIRGLCSGAVCVNALLLRRVHTEKRSRGDYGMTTKALFVSVISRSSAPWASPRRPIATSLRACARVCGVVVQGVARYVVNDDQLSAVVMHVVGGAED